MAKNKDTDPQLTAQQLLEARVDAMMDPSKPLPKALHAPAANHFKSDVTPPSASPSLPAIDIFADSKGAPEMPKKSSLKPPKPKPVPAATDSVSVKFDMLDQQMAADEAEASETAATPADGLPSDEPAVDEEVVIDDAKSDAAIDDIVAQEGDEVLAAEDAGLAEAAEASVEVTTVRQHHPVFWFVIVVLVIVAIFCALVLTNPNLRLPFTSSS